MAQNGRYRIWGLSQACSDFSLTESGGFFLSGCRERLSGSDIQANLVLSDLGYVVVIGLSVMNSVLYLSNHWQRVWQSANPTPLFLSRISGL